MTCPLTLEKLVTIGMKLGHMLWIEDEVELFWAVQWHVICGC